MNDNLRTHRYSDPCRFCGEPAYDYNTPTCSACRRRAESEGRDPLSRLYTPGLADVLAGLRGVDQDDEDPDNDPCDLCGAPTSPLYLAPTGAADPDTGLSRLACPRCFDNVDGARPSAAGVAGPAAERSSK